MGRDRAVVPDHPQGAPGAGMAWCRTGPHSPSACNRPGIERFQPGIKQALEKLVDPMTRDDPPSPFLYPQNKDERSQ